MNPLVSVLIPVYNGERHLKEAIDSALAQTYRPLEVIVVDDESTVPVLPFLTPYGDMIRVIRRSNGGVAAARNTALRESRGELIALLDQDDVWLADKLERQVMQLASQPEIAFTHADVLYRDELAQRDYAQPKPHMHSGFCYGELFLGCSVSACTVLVRRSAVDEVGGFDESIKGTDDYDLALRIARKHPFGYIDSPLAIYRVHDSNWSHRTLDMLDNELRVVRKALKDDPSLPSELGMDIVTTRLTDLLADVGYALFDAGRYDDARRYFAEVLSWRTDTLTLLRWMATFLPRAAVKSIRRAKQGLSPPASHR